MTDLRLCTMLPDTACRIGGAISRRRPRCRAVARVRRHQPTPSAPPLGAPTNRAAERLFLAESARQSSTSCTNAPPMRSSPARLAVIGFRTHSPVGTALEFADPVTEPTNEAGRCTAQRSHGASAGSATGSETLPPTGGEWAAVPRNAGMLMRCGCIARIVVRTQQLPAAGHWTVVTPRCHAGRLCARYPITLAAGFKAARSPADAPDVGPHARALHRPNGRVRERPVPVAVSPPRPRRLDPFASYCAALGAAGRIVVR